MFAEATTSLAEVNMIKAEPSTDSPHKDSAKQKPKRKWGLLGGGKKSKSTGLTKEKSQEELKHRWSTGLPRLPLPPTISKETMVCFSYLILCYYRLFIYSDDFMSLFYSVNCWNVNFLIVNFSLNLKKYLKRNRWQIFQLHYTQIMLF